MTLAATLAAAAVPVSARPRASTGHRPAREHVTVPAAAVRVGEVPIEDGVVGVLGTTRAHSLTLPAASTPRIELLPGGVGLLIDLRLVPGLGDAATLIRSVGEAVVEPWTLQSRPIEGGVRLRIVNPTGTVIARAARRAGTIVVSYGTRDSDARLHELAGALQLPMPEPPDLGADLEVWQDAERVTASGELEDAKHLWERLTASGPVADLAAVRIAELYAISGHINEALNRLRGVARDYPRTVGAAIARLDLLHLEFIIGEGTPTVEQIEVATATIDRASFAAFAELRAAMLLRELGESDLALARMPTPDALPPAWRLPAEQLRQDLVALAIAAPVVLGDPRGTAVAHVAWGDRIGKHLGRDRLLDQIAEAYSTLGLFDRALPLLQERLRSGPVGVEEADIVERIAIGFQRQGDHARAREAVEFQLVNHPAAPQLIETIRALTIERAKNAFEEGRAEVARLRKRSASRALAAALDRLDAELALAWGTPSQQSAALSRLEQAAITQGRAPDDFGSGLAGELGVALARSGRSKEAGVRLRALIDRTADAEARDRLAYHLAHAELALGHTADAERILQRIAGNGTRWGQVARVRLAERRLAAAFVGTGNAPASTK